MFASHQFRSDSSLTTVLQSSSNYGFATAVTGDLSYRLQILASGTIQWGSGGAGGWDVNLYRSAAGVIKTDGTFNCYALGLGTTTFGINERGEAGFKFVRIKDASTAEIVFERGSDKWYISAKATNEFKILTYNGSIWTDPIFKKIIY